MNNFVTMIKKQNKTETSKHSLKLLWWLMPIILSLVIFQKNAMKTKTCQSFGSDIWCIYKRSFPLTRIPAKTGTISTLCFVLWQDLKAAQHLHTKLSGFFLFTARNSHSHYLPQWSFAILQMASFKKQWSATVIICNFAHFDLLSQE